MRRPLALALSACLGLAALGWLGLDDHSGLGDRSGSDSADHGSHQLRDGDLADGVLPFSDPFPLSGLLPSP